MTPEQKVWQLIKPHVPGHVNRIENTASNGIPDVNYCFEGRETWLELKAKPLWHPGSMIALISDVGVVRDTQEIWHATRTKAGGHVLVLSRHEKTIQIMKATSQIGIYISLLEELKPWNWEKIENILKGRYE